MFLVPSIASFASDVGVLYLAYPCWDVIAKLQEDVYGTYYDDDGNVWSHNSTLWKNMNKGMDSPTGQYIF